MRNIKHFLFNRDVIFCGRVWLFLRDGCCRYWQPPVERVDWQVYIAEACGYNGLLPPIAVGHCNRVWVWHDCHNLWHLRSYGGDCDEFFANAADNWVELRELVDCFSWIGWVLPTTAGNKRHLSLWEGIRKNLIESWRLKLKFCFSYWNWWSDFKKWRSKQKYRHASSGGNLLWSSLGSILKQKVECLTV